MRTIKAQDFEEPLLSWARNQFKEEIRSDFKRIRQYDGQRAKEHLAVLQMQSPKQLEILSQVLPLEVFWETPDAIKKRNVLAAEEREAVQKLRADYHAELERNRPQRLANMRRARNPEPETIQQFKLAVKDGNQIHKKTAKLLNFVAARAAPGEWGLLADKSWGKVVISLKLGLRSLSYTIGVGNNLRECIRFHDHFLKALGIGAGNWSIGSRVEFIEKFPKAIEFALWHLREYEVIMDKLWANSVKTT